MLEKLGVWVVKVIESGGEVTLFVSLAVSYVVVLVIGFLMGLRAELWLIGRARELERRLAAEREKIRQELERREKKERGEL